MIPWMRIILYFTLFTLIILRLKKKELPLSNLQTVSAFALKIILGWLYGYIHLHYYNGDDTWQFNNESIAAATQLRQHPVTFFTHLIPEHVHSMQTFKDFVFKSLEHDLMVKLLGIFSLFSGGNYYVNVVFFNFCLFWGHYWLFNFLVKKYPDRKRSLIIGIFFIPPFVFWLSGIRGDGFVFFFLSLFFLMFQRWLTKKPGRFLLYALATMLGIFIFRSAVLFVLFPFVIGWFICESFHTPALPTYCITYLVCCILFFVTGFLVPTLDFPSIVVNKQRAFMALPGKTRFDMQPLQAETGSFLRAIPGALDHVLLRPYLWESNGVLQLVTALETTAYFLFLIISVPFFQPSRIQRDPWAIGCIFFSLSLFIFIGLTIPFPGAIIRYKVIPEMLLLLVLLTAARRIRKKII